MHMKLGAACFAAFLQVIALYIQKKTTAREYPQKPHEFCSQLCLADTDLGFMCVQSFLHKALMPLHKPKCVGLYHQQLAYCVTQVSMVLSFL